MIESRIDSRIESRSSQDHDQARVDAMHAASIVGISTEIVDAISETDIIKDLDARAWLRLALDAQRAADRTASFGEGAWAGITAKVWSEADM